MPVDAASSLAAAWLLLAAAAPLPAFANAPIASPQVYLPSLQPSASGNLIDRLHPRRYAAYHLQPDEPPLEIDGRLDDAAWERVPFTDAFVDIQGPLHWSQPWFTTKVKLRYDAEFLYVGAYLEDSAVWANASHRNAVVFHDNDFEVFVDADATTHNYKEVEVNARNASWNLWLNRPYRDGGHENSTRVDPQHGFDMFGRGFRSAVYTEAPINDPSQRLAFWTVEMALPLTELARYTRVTTLPPAANSFWRINFSRVQWRVRVVTSEDGTHSHYEKIPGVAESNWVWSPQYAVDMHRPEWWGCLQFRNRTERPPFDPTIYSLDVDRYWPHRFMAFQVYYAQAAFRKRHGRYAPHVDDELKTLFPIQEAIEFLSRCEMDVTAAGDFYMAHVEGSTTIGGFAVIQSDSLITLNSKGVVAETETERISVVE